MTDYVKRAKAYARAVVSGKKPAGVYVIAACQRFIDDLKRKDITLRPKGHIEIPADRWCRFLEVLPHVKGKWAREKETLVLSDWQIFFVVNVYGWHWKKNGKRRFREAYVCVPRKNGKTFLVAGLGLGHLLIDGEFGNEVYCGATNEKQAMEVFNPARLICLRDEVLAKHFGIEINKKSLNVHADGALFQPVIGKPGDGSSVGCGIVDEYHEHPDSDLYDTFQTGMGARENPLMLIITTAGYDMSGPCYAKQIEVQHILNGTFDDDSIFGIIYGIDEDDQWDDLAALKKANPNYGISVDDDFLEGMLKQARRSPERQVAFKTKHLNIWVGAKLAWLNMLAYQACRRKNKTLDQFKGREIIVALDLASKIDVSCLGVLVLPSEDDQKYHYICNHYLPEEVVIDGGNLKYREWHSNGWMTATPGNVTDYGFIEEDLKALAKEFQIREVAFDPFQATQFSTRMVALGLPLVEVGQTVKNFSEPMKEVEAMILRKDIEFTFDPVLMWMAGNVVARLDKKDNIFPNREKESAKIDGMVALIMAINRVIWFRDNTTESIYNQMAKDKAQNEN